MIKQIIGHLLLHTAFGLEAILSVSPTTVNKISDFNLMISFDESIGKGGSISIIIPDPSSQISEVFSESPLNKPLQFCDASSLNCFSDDIQLQSCVTPSSSQLDINVDADQFILAGDTVSFSLHQGAKNPSSLWFLQQSYQIKTYNSGGQEIENKQQDINLVSLQPDTISQTSVTYGSDTFGIGSQTIEVSFTNINFIPREGRIEIVFPQRAATSGEHQYFLNSGNFTIETFSINGVNQQNSPQFQYYILDRFSLGQILTIQAPLTTSGDIAQGSQIYIKITEFNNPLSVSQSQGLQIKTFDNLQTHIDQSGLVPLVVQNPAQIQQAAVTIDSASSKVSENSGLMFTFQSPFPLSAGCLIHLTVPESMSNLLSDNIKYIYSYGMFGSMQSLPFLIKQVDGNQVVVVQDACKAFLFNDQEAKLKVKYFKNPDSVRDSGIFKIEVFDSSSNLIAETLSSHTDFQIGADQLSGGQLQSAQITSSNSTVSEQNDILITMALKNGLEIIRSPKVSISIPVGFQLQSSCQIESFSSHIKSSSQGSSCLVEVSERKIILTNIASSSLTHLNGEMNFKVVGALKNHLTEETQIGDFHIKTMIGNDELVEFIIVSNPFAIESGSIYNSDVSYLPSINSESQPDLIFSFVIQHGLVTGSLIFLSIPTQNQELIASSQIQNFGCSGPQVKSSTCSAVQSQDELGQERILIELETKETILPMTEISITLSNVIEQVPRFQGTQTLPISMKTCISGQIVDEENAVFAEVDKLKPFTSVDLSLSSNINLDDSSLLLSFEVSIDELKADDVIIINVPEQMTIEQSNLECLPYSCSIIAQSQNSEAQIKIDGMTGKTIDLEIRGIKNSFSTRPVGPLVVSLFDSKDRLLQKNDQSASFLLSTNQASSTQNVRIIQSSTVPSEASNFTLTIEKNFQEHQLGGLPWVKLTLPECIQFSGNKELEIFDESAVLEEEKFVQFTKYSQYDYVFRLHQGINFFTLMNLMNPNEACLWSAQRLSFEFRTFEDEQLLHAIEQRVEGLEPSLSCKTPCATCGTVDKGFCHSCLDPSSNVLLEETGECIQGTECPSGFYFSDSFNDKCKSCSNGCLECEPYSGLCSQCENGYLLNQSSQLCILEAECKRQQGLIMMSDGTCQECISDCQECGALVDEVEQNAANLSPYYCTKCNDPLKYLHEGLCLDQCPEGFLSKTFFEGQKGLRFLDQSASNHQKRLCVDDGYANQSKLRELFTAGTVVIQQSKPSALLAQFPILILLLGPLILIQYCCQVGRHSLTFREILILTLQGLEYLSLWTLLFKVALAIVHQQRILFNIQAFDIDNDFGAMHSPQVLEDPVRKRLGGLFLLTIVTILTHHLMNEIYHRKLIKVWESVIEEDFTEEFRKNSRTRCCIEYTKLVRYFNYCEWIGMWRRSGSIIPADAGILKDNIQYLFVMFSVRQICYVPRHFLWILLMLTFKYEPLKGKYFTQKYLDGSADLTPEQSQNFEDFEQYSSDIRDFVFNQILEVVVLGLLGNFYFLKWLKDGDVLKLSDNWENHEDLFDGIEDQTQQNANEQSPKTIGMSAFRGQINQTSNSYQREKNQVELNQLHKDDSLVDHNLTPGIRKSNSPDKFQQIQQLNSPDEIQRPKQFTAHFKDEGINSNLQNIQIDDEHLSNRSQLDNSQRPLNPEISPSVNDCKISDPQWLNSRKDKKKAPQGIHQHSIPEVISDKFTIGPNNNEIIFHDDIDLSISRQTQNQFSKLLIEDDPRLLLCTCAKQCDKINAFCECQKIPNQIANSQVYQQLVDEQAEVFNYFQSQIHYLYQNCEFTPEKIQEVKDASVELLITKDFENYHEKFLKIEMDSVWAQFCEQLKEKLLQEIDSTILVFEQPQSHDGMEFQHESKKSKSEKEQISPDRRSQVNQNSALRLKSVHRRVATDASQVEIITEEDQETNADPEIASSQMQDENLIETNRALAVGMQSNRNDVNLVQNQFVNSRAPSNDEKKEGQ